MSIFSDAMKQPLPSKRFNSSEYFDDTFNESVYEESEEDFDFGGDDSFTDDSEEIVDDQIEEDGDDDDDYDDDTDDDDEVEEDGDDDADLEDLTSELDDLDDASDEELDNLESELEDIEDDEVIGDQEEVELNPQEEEEADDLMQLAATTELIHGEMNAEERAEFAESTMDTRIAVSEGFLLESDIKEISDGGEPFMEAKMYAKTKIQFSRDDRKKQLYGVAVNVSAKSHSDPDYFKYLKACKLKKFYKKKLSKKYHTEAIKRMKIYFKRLKSSKSPILSKLGKQVSK